MKTLTRVRRCALRARAPKFRIWTSKIMLDLWLGALFCPIKKKFHTPPYCPGVKKFANLSRCQSCLLTCPVSRCPLTCPGVKLSTNLSWCEWAEDQAGGLTADGHFVHWALRRWTWGRQKKLSKSLGRRNEKDGINVRRKKRKKAQLYHKEKDRERKKERSSTQLYHKEFKIERKE